MKILDVVFDFGGVVFDWKPAAMVRSHFGGDWQGFHNPEALARAIFSHADWQAFDRGERALDEVITQTAQRLAIGQAQMHALMAPIGAQLQPIATTAELLGDLLARRQAGEGIRLLFLSNMPAPFARTLEQRHAFLDCFEGGIFSADVRLAKPQPEIYQLLAERYQLEAARTLFIDDHGPNVQAAAALGWQTLHLTDPAQLRQQLSTHLPQ
jgi:putative hydrolase of the HAD superfamily